MIRKSSSSGRGDSSNDRPADPIALPTAHLRKSNGLVGPSAPTTGKPLHVMSDAEWASSKSDALLYRSLELTKTLFVSTAVEVDGAVALVALRMAGIAPVDPVEEMLAAQMIALHGATIDCAARAACAVHDVMRNENLRLAAKASRAFVSLAEALDRHRRGGEQKVTVEHVHVHAGGQAIVGSISTDAQGGGRKRRRQSHGA